MRVARNPPSGRDRAVAATLSYMAQEQPSDPQNNGNAGKPWTKGGASPNPAGRGARRADGAQTTEQTVRIDGGWSSVITGYNDATRDKRSGFSFSADIVTDVEAREMWRGDDIVAKVVEVLPSDAIRGGFEVKTGDKEEAETIDKYLEDLDACDYIRRAAEYERAYGGAALFPLINDGQDLIEPINLERAQSVDGFVLLEPRELQPFRWANGKVEVWRMQKLVEGGMPPASVYIHASRLIIFPGVRVTEQAVASAQPGWGDSILTRMKRVLRDFGIAWDAAGALVVDFSQGVFTMEGLNDLIARDKEHAVVRRLQIADIARSVVKMMVVDKKDGFERKATPMSGFPETLDRFGQRLSAATGMPVTKLLGVSAAGLNATGEGDEKNWHAVVSAFQSDKLTRPVTRLIEMCLHCANGPTGGKLPDTWSIEWQPLDVPSAKEEADRRYVIAQTDKIYWDIQALDGDTVARNRWGGDTFSPETQINFEERDAMAAAPTDPLLAAGLADPNAPLPEIGPDGLPIAPAPAIDPTTGAPITAEPAKQAMNGAQVQSLIEIVKASNAKEISRESAAAILRLAFTDVDEVTAQRILGPKEFKATIPAPAAPFGGGGGGFGKSAPGKEGDEKPEENAKKSGDITKDPGEPAADEEPETDVKE